MITYSLVSGGTSVAALFMAGYIPGILWGLACMVLIYFTARKLGYRNRQHFSAREAGKILFQAIPSLLLIIIVIGGIIAGIFTATEGSVVAVVYSLVLSFIYRTIKVKDIPKILLDSAEMTGIIIFLIATSSIMSWVMAFTGIPSAVSAGLLALTGNKYVILLIINIVLLIVGTFMDMTPACLIFTPIFLPIATKLGMSSVQFGVMLIFNMCLGNITPPVGSVLFVGCGIGEVTIEEVTPKLIPYFVVLILALLAVTYIPTLSLAIPNAMGLIVK